ncbi:MAG: hypothetical protein IPH06_11070 [Alphaproteobacteria bacterium]|jgi:hypothetical protein|nr:hypothetical protein [Alphaproteobacteria bacterium]QQS56026.1 MAG: hypothetical protein IPN28_06825 [Alphaproteobacteria bacterium]
MGTQHNDFMVCFERRLKLQRTPDSILDIVIQIGYPRWTEPDIEVRCPVAIRGDVGRVKDIAGIDPIDAMKNAISFVESYLKQIDSQTKVLWPDGEAYF